MSTSADRKFLLCYWATYVTECLCLFFHWAFVCFISVNEIAHFRITSAEKYSYFLKFHWSWNLEVLKSSFVLWVFRPSSNRGRFVGTASLFPVRRKKKVKCIFVTIFLMVYNLITINCFCWNQTNWFVAVISGLLEYDKQAQGWERVQEFDGKKIILVPRGHYVELNFTIRSYFPQTCLRGFNLEIRDGSNQATNLLGEFCGDYGTGVVRSSGRYMWLKFIATGLYNFDVFYTARSINETGMMFLSINQYIYIYMYTRFQNRCNLKLHMNIYIPLLIHQKVSIPD